MTDFKNLDIYYGIKEEETNNWIDYKYVRGYLISDKDYTVKPDWGKMSIGGDNGA